MRAVESRLQINLAEKLVMKDAARRSVSDHRVGVEPIRARGAE